MTPCEYEERNSFAELLSPVICSFLPMWMQNWISNLFCLTSWKQEKRNSQRKRIKKKGKKKLQSGAKLAWLQTCSYNFILLYLFRCERCVCSYFYRALHFTSVSKLLRWETIQLTWTKWHSSTNNPPWRVNTGALLLVTSNYEITGVVIFMNIDFMVVG